MLASVDPAPTPNRRLVRRQNDWTLKEHEVVVNHWPDVETIRCLLPHRTKVAIQSFAGKCNLRRGIHVWTGAEDSLLKKRVKEGVPRKAIATDLNLEVGQIINRMRYIGLRYDKRSPSPTGNRLMDAVFERAFVLNMSRRDLDEICEGKGQPFSRWSPARKICIKKVKQVVKYLGGELDVIWEPLDQ